MSGACASSRPKHSCPAGGLLWVCNSDCTRVLRDGRLGLIGWRKSLWLRWVRAAVALWYRWLAELRGLLNIPLSPCLCTVWILNSTIHENILYLYGAIQNIIGRGTVNQKKSSSCDSCVHPFFVCVSYHTSYLLWGRGRGQTFSLVFNDFTVYYSTLSTTVCVGGGGKIQIGWTQMNMLDYPCTLYKYACMRLKNAYLCMHARPSVDGFVHLHGCTLCTSTVRMWLF